MSPSQPPSTTTSIPGVHTNLSCARCHTSEQQLGETLKRCARCQTVKYCSRDCQKEAWNSHKAFCKSDPETLSLIQGDRTTMRVDLSSMGGPEINAGTIYYLEVSRPHLHDVQMFGPFYQLEHILPCMQSALQDCGRAFANFQKNFVKVHEADGRVEVQLFYHWRAPINHSPNEIKVVRLIKERNPQMLEKKPDPGYVVLGTEPDLDVLDARNGYTGDLDFDPLTEIFPVKALTMHGTFDSKAAADAHVLAVARGVVAGMPGVSLQEALDQTTGHQIASIFKDGIRMQYMVQSYCVPLERMRRFY